MVEEIWKTCEGKEGYEKYEVSNLSRVRNKHNGKIVKPAYNKATDTMRIQFYMDGVIDLPTLHRLVGAAFLDVPDKPYVIVHKNGDKTDCSLENLEAIDYKEKAVRRFKRERELSKWHRSRAKAFKMINQITEEVFEFDSIKQASIKLGVDRSSVSRVVNKVKGHYTVGGWKLYE